MNKLDLKRDVEKAVEMLEPLDLPDGASIVAVLRSALTVDLDAHHPRTPLLSLIERVLRTGTMIEMKAPDIIVQHTIEARAAMIAELAAAMRRGDPDAAFFEPRNTRTIRLGELELRHDEAFAFDIDESWPSTSIDLAAHYADALERPTWQRRWAEQKRVLQTERSSLLAALHGEWRVIDVHGVADGDVTIDAYRAVREREPSVARLRETAFVLGRFARFLGPLPDYEVAMVALRGSLGGHDIFVGGADFNGEGMGTLRVAAATPDVASRAAEVIVHALFVEDDVADVLAHSYNDTDGVAIRQGVRNGQLFFDEYRPGAAEIPSWRETAR